VALLELLGEVWERQYLEPQEVCCRCCRLISLLLNSCYLGVGKDVGKGIADVGNGVEDGGKNVADGAKNAGEWKS
jgi:hypothetical protein